MQHVSTVVLRLKKEKFNCAVKICDLSCFLLRDNENDLKFAMRCSTKFQRIVERCQRIGKHIANAFQNNNSALGSVLNGLKNVQCIFGLSLMPGFVNRVTYSLMHPTETAIRRLVLGYFWA